MNSARGRREAFLAALVAPADEDRVRRHVARPDFAVERNPFFDPRPHLVAAAPFTSVNNHFERPAVVRNGPEFA